MANVTHHHVSQPINLQFNFLYGSHVLLYYIALTEWKESTPVHSTKCYHMKIIAARHSLVALLWFLDGESIKTGRKLIQPPHRHHNHLHSSVIVEPTLALTGRVGSDIKEGRPSSPALLILVSIYCGAYCNNSNYNIIDGYRGKMVKVYKIVWLRE